MFKLGQNNLVENGVKGVDKGVGFKGFVSEVNLDKARQAHQGLTARTRRTLETRDVNR